MRKDPAWAGRAEAGSSTAAANSPARQAHFLSPGPRGERSQCSVCDPRQTATLSGPQGPLPPEVEDPGGSVGRGPPASALAFLPPVHTTPPFVTADPEEAGREQALLVVVCAKTAPPDSLTQQKLAAPEPAASEPQRLGRGWGLGHAADNSGEVVGRGLRGPHTGGREDKAKASWDPGELRGK